MLWQYPPAYILSRFGSIRQAISSLGSIRRRLAFYSIADHALAVSAEAISCHALASRLGSISRGLACYILT